MNVTTTNMQRDGRDLLAETLRVPVWNALAERADAIRRSLPPRPNDPHGHYVWLRSLDDDQARRAELLDRLDSLCAHISGRPVPGYASDDPLPVAALDEVDGFIGNDVALLIARYRARVLLPARR
ncbi:hypothetical protein ACIQU6_28055 [Streptomyces sp. NPDC090442]|uniref:hypothetical protein n=1 Tax=Streptomyces sp. NPDC090442 TaxID=3365962 RepID=UPI003830DF46